MTTVDLLQRYLIHEHSNHDCKVSHCSRAFNSKSDHVLQDQSLPDPDPSHYLDAKTKALHDMLDGAVRDLANCQSDSTSEYEGTLWRSPLQPRVGSPDYSEISDSFESPAMIEHCTNDLLSTPMSPTSGQLKGPDGWPLGIEVAMNDFRRGKLSTAVLDETELPNGLILRKHPQPTLHSESTSNRGGQETVSCKRAFSELGCDNDHVPESVDVQSNATQMQWSSVQFEQHGERRDLVERVSLRPLTFQQQSFTRPRQNSGCRDRHVSQDRDLFEVQQRSDGECRSDVSSMPTISAPECDSGNSPREKASTDPDPVLANGRGPIGLPRANTGPEFFFLQDHNTEHNTSHIQTGTPCLLHRHSCQTQSSHTLEANGNAHQAESPAHAVADALDKQTRFSGELHSFDIVGVEVIDCGIGDRRTIQKNRDDSFQAIASLTFQDSKANSGGDVVSQKTSGLLEDILEDSEDLLTSPSQHFTMKSDKFLGLREIGGAGKKSDRMVASQVLLNEPSATLLSRPRAPPPLQLTIKHSNKLLVGSTQSSRQHVINVNPAESNPPAKAMAEPKTPTRKEGHFSAAALERLRKTAESQSHFLTGPDSPEDQSQAAIHPLLRARSFPRLTIQASTADTDAALKYVFKDDDCERYEGEGGASDGHLMQGTERLISHTSTKEDTSSQIGKLMQDTAPENLCTEDQMEDQGAGSAYSSTPQRSTLRSSNENTLASSLEDTNTSSCSPVPPWPLVTNYSPMSAAESPDLTPSPISQPSISSATTGYQPDSAARSPTLYNSWALNPRHRERGNLCSTPTSGTTVPTSPVPTPNTSFETNTPASHGMKMTPSSSFGDSTGHLSSPCAVSMTPSVSFEEVAANKGDRRSMSFSSMFGRYHKARYPEPPSPVTTDSIFSSKKPAKTYQDTTIANDPFTSTHNGNIDFSLNLRMPRSEDRTDPPAIAVDKFDSPTKRASGRFSLHRRSLSIPGRPSTEERLERTLSTLVFNPNSSRPRKRNITTAASTNSTAGSDGSGIGHRRSLCIAPKTGGQKWEIAPSPTSMHLRDDFSTPYRPQLLEAGGHYASRRDALQGVKDGWKKVFGRQ